MDQISVELQEWMGSDRSIAKAAWTSSLSLEDIEIKEEKDVSRLVNMLADKGHSVPFESVVFRFWISLPIQTDRQHMTHRIASHSGLSGRYRTMPSKWYRMPQDVLDILNGPVGLSEVETQYESFCRTANEWYKSCLFSLKAGEKRGELSNEQYKRVREFIRGVLPQNNMTERVTIINLRSFSNYYRLRAKTDAQPEIQFIAKEMLRLIEEKNICPVAIEALKRNQFQI